MIVDLDVAPPAGGRPGRVTPPRSVALFLVALLTLVVVTGSARPAPPLTGPLWSTAYDRDDDVLTVTPTALYLFHHDAAGPVLTAYDLASGAVRWSQPAPDIAAQVPSPAAGVVVAPDAFERYFNRPDLLLARTTRTIARDARTGAALWRSAGAPQDVTDRSVLLLGNGSLSAVGLRDGHPLWSRPAPGLAGLVVAGETVVTASTDGLLTVLAYGDGSVLRTTRVPWSESSRLSAAAGRLVVTRQEPGGQTSTVYEPATLTELWRSGRPLTGCGSVLCSAEPGGLLGHDPATGARLWQVPGMTAAWPIAADRIIAASDLNGVFQLLNPVTGELLGTVGTGLGSWRTDPGLAVDGAPPPSSAFVLRAEGALFRLDVRTGARTPLGIAGGTGWIGCRTVPKYLVCRQNTRVTVTAVE